MTSETGNGARSWLFAPGDSERKMRKVVDGTADAVIFDLEDAVAVDAKPAARAQVAGLLAELRRSTPDNHRDRLWVRINPLASAFALDDLAAVMPGAPAGIMLPKPIGRTDVDTLDHYLSALEAANGLPLESTRVFALVTEEPSSLLSLSAYQEAPRLAAMSWGAEDLAAAVGASDNRGPYDGYDFTYEMARSLCLVTAAAAGVMAVETIHGDFRDEDGLRERVAKMRRAGWDGMLAIHPAQVEVINAAFTPSDDEIAAAQEVVDLFAAHPGAGTIGHNGEMLDRPHLVRARALLARVRKS